jgi:hypothetical protein
LFGAPVTAAAGPEAESSATADLPFSWQWLAPSMALVCVGLFLASQQHGMLAGINPGVATSLLTAATLDQANLSTYMVSARHSENNTPMVGLEWTNGSFALSTTPTNQLIH